MADYTAQARGTGITMQCPVRLGLNRNGKEMWTFPFEPLVSVKGGKTIVRRNIAKAVTTGTVKEQWSMDDWEITIEGVFISSSADKYPETDVSKLKSFLKVGKSVAIRCKILDVLGIDLMCIQDWDFPATPGLENQAFTIRGYSDQDFDLLV